MLFSTFPSPLHLRVVTARTDAQYQRAVFRFLRWLADTGVIDDERFGFDSMDAVVAFYINFLWTRRHPRSWAVLTVYGLRHLFPQFAGELPTALRSLKGWLKVQPSRQRAVMSKEVACLLAFVMKVVFRDECAAVLTLLGFDCYLRCAELTHVRRRDLVRLRQDLYVRIPASKTGLDQGVRVLDDRIAKLAWRLAKRKKPDEFLFPSASAARYRALFMRALDLLGLTECGYTPHSLRHGGATFDFHVRGMSVDDILLRGRWRAVASARHYVRSLPALLAKVSVPDELVQLGSTVERLLVGFLDIPLPEGYR